MNKNQIKRPIMSLLLAVLLSLIFIVSGVVATPIQDAASHQQHTTPEASSEKWSLQHAINQASPGATIELAAGTYTEILTISTSLHLKGSGAAQTILKTASSANGYAIHINAPDVIISDLSITNQGPGLYTTGIKITASHASIQDCIIHDTPIGIALWSSQNTISHCTFVGCEDEGIVLLGTETNPCTTNTIASCSFHDNCDGIELQHATGNLITNCTFIQNTHAGIDAIQAGNTHNIIEHCSFIDNTAYGVYLSHSSYTLISGCRFYDDVIILVQSTDNSLQNSQVGRIHLMKDSFLRIHHCTGLSESSIISQQSGYEIQTEHSGHLTTINTPYRWFYLTLRSIILSRLNTLKVLSKELTQVRM
jgi:parallel beta-helix repeat protein